MPLTKAEREKARRTGKFYHHGRPLGWRKDMGQAKRREAALDSRKNNPLKAARALNSLANVTTDPETRRRARADANYFFRLHQRLK